MTYVAEVVGRWLAQLLISLAFVTCTQPHLVQHCSMAALGCEAEQKSVFQHD